MIVMIWYACQVFVGISFFIGFINLLRKKYKIGLIQFFLSPWLLINSFVFAMHRNWVNGDETPQEFFIRMLKVLDIRSIIFLFGILILIYLFIQTVKNDKTKK